MIEYNAAYYLHKPAKMNSLFFILAAVAMLFQQSVTADTASPPPGHDVTFAVRHKSMTEPTKASVTPAEIKCLLAFGGAPLEAMLLPGILKGTVNPTVMRAANPATKTRTWSAPDPREPAILLHYVEISGSRFQVLGVHTGSQTYEIQTLRLRDPTVALPCGLRVGQSVNRFIKALGKPADSTQPQPGDKVEYAWDKYAPGDGFMFAWHANIVLRLGPKLAVQEIWWRYFAD